jgi:hypothetical protein
MQSASSKAVRQYSDGRALERHSNELPDFLAKTLVPLVVIPLARSKLLTQPIACVSGVGFPLTPREGDFFVSGTSFAFRIILLYLGSNAGAGRET